MSPGNVHFYFPIVTCLLLRDRKSTRLNSSHGYNLVCRLLLEKKKNFACRDKLMQDKTRHKFRLAIIIVSDDDDHNSRVTRDQALEMAQKADVVVYAISASIT